MSARAFDGIAASCCGICGERQGTRKFAKDDWDFVRCSGCGVVRVDPLPTPARLSELYERLYQQGSYVHFAKAHDVRDATAVARLAALRPFMPAGPWLEVGSSTGAFLRVATDAGIDIEGLDVSATAVVAARAAGLRATASTIEAFVPTQKYAGVIAFDLLEHLIAPAEYLGRVRQWLEPDGRLVVTVPDIGSFSARLMGARWYYYAPPQHLHYFDRYTLTRTLARSGLRVVQMQAAPKVLTPQYAAAALRLFNPLIGRVAEGFTAALPATWRNRTIPIPVGELLAIAECG